MGYATIMILVHVVISLAAIATGFFIMHGLLNGRLYAGWAKYFLITNVLTSVTGYMIPAPKILPSHIVGAICLIVLALAIYAQYSKGLAGRWRGLYVAGVTTAFYLNVFVLIVQLFQRVPALKAAAPTQTEPPFALAQGAMLVVFITAGVLAGRRFKTPLAAA